MAKPQCNDTGDCGRIDPAHPKEIRGFTSEVVSAAGMEHVVYRTGKGPAVYVLHELPGLYDRDIELACRIAQDGFTSYVPLFFGEPGKSRTTYFAFRECLLPSEFSCWTQRTSRVAPWLEAQLSKAHEACGGKGVGVIGMCMTGALPLALLKSKTVKAAVLCQPTFPLFNRSGLDLSKADRNAAAARTDVDVLALKFIEDSKSPDARFRTLRKLLRGHYTDLVIDSTEGTHDVSHDAHSVLAGAYSCKPGSPTRKLYERVIRYLDTRLSDTPSRKPFPSEGECRTASRASRQRRWIVTHLNRGIRVNCRLAAVAGLGGRSETKSCGVGQTAKRPH